MRMISGKSPRVKLPAECERMFRCPIPKYTESAPPSMAAVRQSKLPAGAIISNSFFCIGCKGTHFIAIFAFANHKT